MCFSESPDNNYNTDDNIMNFDVIKGISTNIDDSSTELHKFPTNINNIITNY